VLKRDASVLTSVLVVAVRGHGVLLGLVEFARLVVASRLQVVVSGGGVMGGGLVMVLNRGVRGRCCHRSSLLGIIDLWFLVPGQSVSLLELVRKLVEFLLGMEKKPTWLNTQRYSTTSAYSSTSPSDHPGCSSSSLPTS